MKVYLKTNELKHKSHNQVENVIILKSFWISRK